MTVDLDPSSQLLRQRRSIDILVCTIAISFILHIVASTILLLPGHYSVPLSAPLFVDLKSMAVPVEAPLQEVPSPEVPSVPETESVPLVNPETVKMERAIESTLQKAAVSPEVVHENSIGLGMISGHFSSFAQGESLKDEIRVYYFELMRRINEVWWTAGASKGSFVASASVNLVISRDGKVVGCELMESSGSREQDQALLESIKKAEPLPPLPTSFRQLTFNAPIRFVPPLQLMFPGSGKKNAAPH